MRRSLVCVLVGSFAGGCDLVDLGRTAPCGAAEAHPPDANAPEWSYHGPADGASKWGALAGYEACAVGREQSPIDIVTTDEVDTPMSDLPIRFANYERDLAIDLLDDGHTLKVVVPSAGRTTDPQVEFDGKAYFLVEFHYHSPSEHTVDGIGSLFEVHLVHRAADDSLLVVGVLYDEGAPDPTIDTLLADDPGHERETTCTDAVRPARLVPVGSGYFHYVGSLTTPGCTEGVQWFVSDIHSTASAEQAAAWQENFHGTTNRPLQPLDGRIVTYIAPE